MSSMPEPPGRLPEPVPLTTGAKTILTAGVVVFALFVWSIAVKSCGEPRSMDPTAPAAPPPPDAHQARRDLAASVASSPALQRLGITVDATGDDGEVFRVQHSGCDRAVLLTMLGSDTSRGPMLALLRQQGFARGACLDQATHTTIELGFADVDAALARGENLTSGERITRALDLLTAPDGGTLVGAVCRAHRLLSDLEDADRRTAQGRRAMALLSARERPLLAEERRSFAAGRMVQCRDGETSPTCECGGSHRGCCSHHGGISGCEPLPTEITCP